MTAILDRLRAFNEFDVSSEIPTQGDLPFLPTSSVHYVSGQYTVHLHICTCPTILDEMFKFQVFFEFLLREVEYEAMGGNTINMDLNITSCPIADFDFR